VLARPEPITLSEGLNERGNDIKTDELLQKDAQIRHLNIKLDALKGAVERAVASEQLGNRQLRDEIVTLQKIVETMKKAREHSE
jgi:seryl-tRNA synthetase